MRLGFSFLGVGVVSVNGDVTAGGGDVVSGRLVALFDGEIALTWAATTVFGRSPRYVLSIDEVGRGCLAGPVAVGATLAEMAPASALTSPDAGELTGELIRLAEVVKDSKKLTQAKHRAVVDRLLSFLGRTASADDSSRYSSLAVEIRDVACVFPRPERVMSFQDASSLSTARTSLGAGGGGGGGGGSGFVRSTPLTREVQIVARDPDSSPHIPVVVDFCVSLASAAAIDAVGIFGAIKAAAVDAARRLIEREAARIGTSPSVVAGDTLVIFDGDDELGIPADIQPAAMAIVVKGDARVRTVGLASIVAKAARDQLMERLDAEIPGYGLAAHKGYGTPAHIKALKELGHSSIHRKSFRLNNRSRNSSG